MTACIGFGAVLMVMGAQLIGATGIALWISRRHRADFHRRARMYDHGARQ